MIDWLSSMRQTYEYYIVDPNTWKDVERIDNVTACTISRDSTVETLGSASIDIKESVGESYIRVYLVATQNRLTEKIPLGTFLVQTPSSGFNGKVRNVTMDAYTPLIELRENPPPIGYFIPKGDNIMDSAYRSIRENVRAPVVKPSCTKNMETDFVADTNDTWLSFHSDLIANADYILDLDGHGRILFAPKQELKSMQPVWTYNDDNSSILYPDFTMDHDLYGVPNVVEVMYSNGKDHGYTAENGSSPGTGCVRVVNDDENSPASTIARGREIKKVITNPDLPGIPTEKQVKDYAEKVLSELSSIEYTVTYTHGYCPVRVGDCVRLNYTRAGLKDIKAKVISQSISCTLGCPVTETAVFTTNLWR